MYFDFCDKKIYYKTIGNGKPLVLLNGIMMSTASWQPFVSALSEQNTLILLDFLDQGKSAYMDEDYDQAVQAEVLLALLNHLGINKASLMGVSYGGEVAIKFAVKYGDRTDRLMLFNTTAKTSDWLRDIGDGWKRIGDTCDGQTYYDVTIPVIYSSGFYQNNREWMEKRKKVLVPLFSQLTFQQRMKRLVNSSDRHDCVADLQKIKNPTLVVTCADDTLVPHGEQETLVKNIKNAQYVVVPDCGHCFMYEKPLLFTSLILGFTNVKDTEYEGF